MLNTCLKTLQFLICKYIFYLEINLFNSSFRLKTCINPLVTDPLYLVCMAKISILKNEGIIEKISYERRADESVDDRSHS